MVYAQITARDRMAQEREWNGTVFPPKKPRPLPEPPNRYVHVHTPEQIASFKGGQQIGVAAEHRFMRICTDAKRTNRMPRWYCNCRRATMREEGRGIDAVAYTRFGFPILIQLKSSDEGERLFRANPRYDHANIVCIVVAPEADDETILATTITKLIRAVRRMRRRRAMQKRA